MTAPVPTTADLQMPSTSTPEPTGPKPAQAPDAAAARTPADVTARPRRFSGDSLLTLVGGVIAALLTLFGGITIALLSIFFYTIDDRFDKIDQRLAAQDAKIAELDTRLTAQIAELDTRLTAQITEVDTRLTAQITQLDLKLTALTTQLDLKLTALTTQLDLKLTALIAGLNMTEHVEAALAGRLLGAEGATAPP